MATVDAGGDDLRKIITRVHASCMFVITVSGIVVSSLGRYRRVGPYRLLADQPWGYVGLFQAYSLMFLIFATLWICSAEGGRRRWNAIGLVAHLPPLVVNIISQDVFEATHTEHFSIIGFVIHGVFISLETFALLWKASWFGPSKRS
jgi:hypothetical protein